MKILLQFPEGLKQKGLELSKKYESEGHEVFLSASPCYGACDIALDEARWLKVDKIVHIGHNKFVKNDLPIPVEYVEYNIDVDTNGLVAVLPYIEKYKNIAVATTVQHIHQFDQMKAFFERNGKKVFAEGGYWATKPGQVLGCDSFGIKKVEGKVDAIVFIGNGMFHPLAIDVSKDETGKTKPVLVYNTYDGKVRNVSEDIEHLKKRRKGSIAAALSCKTFGILVSTKVGQFNLAQAIWAKKELEKRGFTAGILTANELDPLTVNNFMVFDCYVNTACPRIVDDLDEFSKPLLNIDMLREVFEIMDANKNPAPVV
ncbi:diphthamide biosynthesis enzyme Dph2 [Candidatus Micrarchaeota archaeon]|nr:diphthamide biosynthesis enzyme Dph2 [Candidatus Micrarchaeota archaeon]